MAVDQSEAFHSEDEAPEGPLDYGQHYPTMLPFLPPDQEAALQVRCPHVLLCTGAGWAVA
jgi:hypothetical protein